MKDIVLTGFVKSGTLTMRNRKALQEELRHWFDCEVLVTIQKAHATRNLDQNALYWAGYVRPLSEHTGYTPHEMHAYLKKRYLPKKHLLLQDPQGVVLDETDLDALTTTTLNKIEFGEYLREIEGLAMELGVIVGSNRESAA